MMFVCQVAYVGWSATLAVGYMCVSLHGGRTQTRDDDARDGDLRPALDRRDARDGQIGEARSPHLFLVVALLAASLGVVCAALQAFAVVVVYGVRSPTPPAAWPWWGYQLGFRACELAMASTISYVATRPLYRRKRAPCCGASAALCRPWRRKPKAAPGGDSSPFWVESSAGRHLVDSFYGEKLRRPEEDRLPLRAMEAPPGGGTPARALRPTSDTSEKSRSSRSSREKASRPTSMIVSDNGFIRFRKDTMDIGEGIEMTDEEQTDLDSSTPTSPYRGCDDNTVGWTTPAAGGSYTYRQVPEADRWESPPLVEGEDEEEEDEGEGDFAGFRPPSSINLNASIEEELNQRLLREYNRIRGFSSFRRAPSMVTVSPPGDDDDDDDDDNGDDRHAASMVDLDANVADRGRCGGDNRSCVSLRERAAAAPGVMVRSNSDVPIRHAAATSAATSWERYLPLLAAGHAATTSAERRRLGSQISARGIPVPVPTICITDETRCYLVLPPVGLELDDQ
ncbi:PREDICTED: uncharacterized protein LOC106818029 [Priapulus caudatus]|uniref:Uncharacterized protein LOC106818029 n=1 Tax=Priapulus caudatus TaxID=37621 RepID=A0ABM1F1A8_PRICU|nr:PREDICTED: uncharacterized protein LOC106818029 [Priapulus caudatus]